MGQRNGHNNTTINYSPERGKKVQSESYRDVGQTGGATASGQRRKVEKEEGMTERMETTGDRLLVTALTEWRDDNKESATQTEQWPQRGGERECLRAEG